MSEPSPESHRRQSVAKKVMFATIATCLFFGMLEGGLWLVSGTTVEPQEDPFVGFSGHYPLLKETSVEGTSVMRTAPSKRVWFNDQSFPAKKAENTVRIVCLGGSTTFGRPFSDTTSFCGWLREALPIIEPDVHWEVINAGGVSYASYRVVRVMEEFLKHDVDLFIVYTGQNEFLEWRTYGSLADGLSPAQQVAAVVGKTHVGQLIRSVLPSSSPRGKSMLSAEVDEMLNHSVGPTSYRRDDTFQKSVVGHFADNLERMRRLAKQSGARLCIVRPASNLRDCSPFKADFSDGLDGSTRDALTSDLEFARSAFAEGNLAAAGELLNGILQIDDRHADVHYQLGQVLFLQGEFDLALDSFQRAIDEDICPLRATSEIKSVIADFVAEGEVLDCDFETRLSDRVYAARGDRCLGSEEFLDHVHPTLDGHREIAAGVIETLFSCGVVGRSPTDKEWNDVSTKIQSTLGLEAQGEAFRNLAKVFHWSGKFEDAARNALDAIRLLPNDLESRFIYAQCLAESGQPAAALEAYEELFARGGFQRALLPYGELLAESGQTDAAKSYLLQSILADRDDVQARAYYSLGKLHLRLGETRMAIECLEAADRMIPGHRPTQTLLREARLASP